MLALTTSSSFIYFNIPLSFDCAVAVSIDGRDLQPYQSLFSDYLGLGYLAISLSIEYLAACPFSIPVIASGNDISYKPIRLAHTTVALIDGHDSYLNQ